MVSRGRVYRRQPPAPNWPRSIRLTMRRCISERLTACPRRSTRAEAGRYCCRVGRHSSWPSLLAEERQSLCVYRVFVLVPHPTDVSTVFRTLGCVSGRTTAAALQVSHDMGEHWPERFQPPGLFVRALVGGRGADPGRFYLAANNTFISGAATGGALYRSDDNAVSWNGLTPLPSETETSTAVSALTYD